MAQPPKYRDFTFTFSVPAGTLVGTQTKEIHFPTEYTKCTGIKVYPNSAFTQRLGFSNKTGDIFELTHPDDWRTTTSIAPADRWKTCDIDTVHDLTLKYSPLATVAVTETFDIIFQLS